MRGSIHSQSVKRSAWLVVTTATPAEPVKLEGGAPTRRSAAEPELVSYEAGLMGTCPEIHILRLSQSPGTSELCASPVGITLRNQWGQLVNPHAERSRAKARTLPCQPTQVRLGSHLGRDSLSAESFLTQHLPQLAQPLRRIHLAQPRPARPRSTRAWADQPRLLAVDGLLVVTGRLESCRAR